MNPIIYYRKSLMEKDELQAAKKYFDCVDLITEIPENSFVIGRFSLFPFYYDQQREIQNLYCKLINTYNQYQYIADLGNYVIDLENLTPKTWSKLEDLPEDGTKFVLKGETNSRKNSWKTSMFAENKKQAIDIHGVLCNDSLIGNQKIYIREYVPLYKYMDGINGMPVTKEFRFFVAYDKIISGAYYWQNYIDDLNEKPDVEEVPKDFLNEVINRVGDKSNFYVVDVAQTQEGKWIVIELNSGQFSGLSCNDPDILYKNLYEVINERICSNKL